jgi:hypothetical protein
MKRSVWKSGKRGNHDALPPGRMLSYLKVRGLSGAIHTPGVQAEEIEPGRCFEVAGAAASSPARTTANPV